MNNSQRRLQTLQRQLTTSPINKKPLHYTRDQGPLTYLQRQFYEHNGYVVIPSIFKPQDLSPLHNKYVEICRNPKKYVSKTVGTLTRDINIVDGTINVDHLPAEYKYIKLQNFTGQKGDEEIFWDGYARNEKLLPYVRQFVHSNELSTTNHMYVCKPPGLNTTGNGTGSTRHPLHQDLLYFPIAERDATGSMTSRDDNGIVACWAAVGDCNRQNGCLCFIPGSHKRGMRKHNYPASFGKSNLGYLAISDIKEQEMQQRIHAEMKAGDVVFFHPQTIHGSGINKNEISNANKDDWDHGFRKAISVHYRRRDLTFIDHSALPKFVTAIDSFGKDAIAATQEERKQLAKLTTAGFKLNSREI